MNVQMDLEHVKKNYGRRITIIYRHLSCTWVTANTAADQAEFERILMLFLSDRIILVHAASPITV